MISLACLAEFYDFPKAFRKLCNSAVVMVKLLTANCCHRCSAPKYLCSWRENVKLAYITVIVVWNLGVTPDDQFINISRYVKLDEETISRFLTFFVLVTPINLVT